MSSASASARASSGRASPTSSGCAARLRASGGPVRRPEWIARQAARPFGVLGWLLGRIMAVETAEANRLALELLAPRRTDRILEVGFGHGATIERLSRIVDEGVVAGIDVSEAMLRLAKIGRASCREDEMSMA